jgi:predicted RNA binding protein YcfA (HicA-like mRNA interferase family)
MLQGGNQSHPREQPAIPDDQACRRRQLSVISWPVGLLRSPDAVQTVIQSWFDFSPRGYSDWRQGDGGTPWQRLASELATAIPQLASAKVPALPLEGLVRADDFFDLRLEDIPIYCVGRGVIADALFSAPSRREVIRVLKHFGYRLLPGRGKASHEVWGGPGKRMFTVPSRDPLSPGVFQELLHHFGWTKQHYTQEIRMQV